MQCADGVEGAWIYGQRISWSLLCNEIDYDNNLTRRFTREYSDIKLRFQIKMQP